MIKTILLAELHTAPDKFQFRDAHVLETHAKEIADSWSDALYEPIKAWKDVDGVELRLIVLSGHHRFRAAQIRGMVELTVDVIECTYPEAVEIAIAGNTRRRDYTPMEYAKLIEYYRSTMINENSIAAKIGKTERQKREYASLLLCSDYLRNRISDGTIDYKSAGLIAESCKKWQVSKEKQNQLAMKMVDKKSLSAYGVAEFLKQIAPSMVTQGELFDFDLYCEKSDETIKSLKHGLKILDAACAAGREAIALGIGNGAAKIGLTAFEEARRKQLHELNRAQILADSGKDIGPYKHNPRGRKKV